MQPGYDTLGFISCTGKLAYNDSCIVLQSNKLALNELTV